MEKYPQQNLESEYNFERGEDVRILLKFIRHGERTTDGYLEDHGREVTKQKARESGIKKGDFDAVKAFGSDAGPQGSTGMGRSLETADIYAHEIAGDEAFVSRAKKILNYETFLNGLPFDWRDVYDNALPKNYDELEPTEKKEAAKIAQEKVVNKIISLQTPEAESYKKETAGAHATVVLHYLKMTERLNSGSQVLLPVGTHGGSMEFLLQQALIRRGDDEEVIRGFESLEEIGGEFDPSDSYTIDIHSVEPGKVEELKVIFDNPERPQLEMYLDIKKLEELADYYEQIHAEKMG